MGATHGYDGRQKVDSPLYAPTGQKGDIRCRLRGNQRATWTQTDVLLVPRETKPPALAK